MPQRRREPRIGASRPRGGLKKTPAISQISRARTCDGHDADIPRLAEPRGHVPIRYLSCGPLEESTICVCGCMIKFCRQISIEDRSLHAGSHGMCSSVGVEITFFIHQSDHDTSAGKPISATYNTPNMQLEKLVFNIIRLKCIRIESLPVLQQKNDESQIELVKDDLLSTIRDGFNRNQKPVGSIPQSGSSDLSFGGIHFCVIMINYSRKFKESIKLGTMEKWSWIIKETVPVRSQIK
ncbi:hypothetical protein G5I_12671 [Acromyrmex echinatior]|uniref:Uncharacterized protein n=1 Tax=Acromyrmex echinatior TaxID=103372 RepID=F4X2Y6_ACREC|nr:hypothetical protein G5I_12671 [Acromyrmex echinatior]